MEDYSLFIYWAYLMPAVITASLGFVAVERGCVPEELRYMTKNNQYFNVMFHACFPIFNIFAALAYAAMNVKNWK